MKLEQQVCTLSQAQKLNELGIEQNSLFYWKENEIQTVLSDKKMCETIQTLLPGCNEYYSAFTVAELGQMLGRFARNTSSISICDDGNEAFDRADDLIHLIEIGELLVDSCNERLNEN